MKANNEIYIFLVLNVEAAGFFFFWLVCLFFVVLCAVTTQFNRKDKDRLIALPHLKRRRQKIRGQRRSGFLLRCWI